jgi:hypothetical protein
LSSIVREKVVHRFGLESSFSWSASTTCDDLTDAALDAANSWLEYLENTVHCERKRLCKWQIRTSLPVRV